MEKGLFEMEIEKGSTAINKLEFLVILYDFLSLSH